VHGSTITGHTDWSEIVPVLAKNRHVIIPDCRGHGRSTNPNLSYSFREHAADMSALIKTLGYEKAHVVGHSNGGNIVLVMLLEHPEVVASCVPQAANAYVSQDLIDKEPAIFDPDRVAREKPEWRDEMISLHSGTHGAEYWRTLLKITVDEIIAEPNYTPDDLARVSCPVLVIMGELDHVNAPAQHAQHIAKHIPSAELWIPAGIGHNVHIDLPGEWLEKV